MPEGVDGYLDHIVDAIGGVDRAQVAGIAGALWQAWEDDRTVYIVGNGGSASTASHMACDLAKQTQVAGRRPLRSIALHDNPALLTALANDADYSRVFSESLAIYGRPGDVLITISCSGRSANVLGAIAAARDIGMRVIALGGAGGGEMARLADLHVNVPSHDYGVIESGHVAIEHCLTFLLHERGRASAGSRPAVLVDRDGVIVRNRDDYVKGWDEVDLIPGSVEALARLSKGGHRVFVITNQSAVGRGIMSRDELDGIHARLAAEVSSLGGRIEAFLVCPHRPDERCDCRKPNTGLLEEARDAYGVDLRRTVMIGDHETDLEAASRAGIDGILVLSGRSSEAPDGVPVRHVAADLHSATEFLLAT